MNYFKPLRRKVGVITLLIACTFAMAWTMSRSVYIEFLLGTDKCFLYLSRNGFWILQPESEYSGGVGYGWNIFPARSPEHSGPEKFFDDDELLWRWQWIGFDFGEWLMPSISERKTFWIIPYWSLVVPPTLLSAYLLLGKPRPPKDVNQSTQT